MVSIIENPVEIIVSIETQRIQLVKARKIIFERKVSTAKNGAGELFGSECTPRGRHVIRAKVGANAVENSVFVARRETSEIYSTELRNAYPNRDWILTRIMWLSGLERHKNRMGNVDTMRRYIYIHGCPNEDEMGVPSSHGCIKMRNIDVIKLFSLVDVGTIVTINDSLIRE